VQGIGKVGMHLLEHLKKEGATLYVADINEAALKQAAEMGAIVVSGDDMYDLDVDVFAPCALGAILNDNTIPRLKCQVVAGAANNQLEDEKIHGDLIKSKGIVYAPDFVINAGGLINVYSEYTGYVREQAMAQAENIYKTILDIYTLADNQNVNNQQAAIKLAEKRIQDMMLVHSTY
jgi:leucine dehydrogenase